MQRKDRLTRVNHADRTKNLMFEPLRKLIAMSSGYPLHQFSTPSAVILTTDRSNAALLLWSSRLLVLVSISVLVSPSIYQDDIQ